MKVKRIFLASSNDMHEERAIFQDILDGISETPALKRNYCLKSILWEKHSHVTGKNNSIQKSIDDSVHYDELDIVIIAIRDRIGTGTRMEYEKVRELYNKRGCPKFRIMFRATDTVSNDSDNNEINTFKESLLREGTITNIYEDIGDFKRQLTEYISAALLEKDNSPTPREVNHTTTAYTGWTLITACLAIIGLFFASKMTFPDKGVDSISVLYIFTSVRLRIK